MHIYNGDKLNKMYFKKEAALFAGKKPQHKHDKYNPK